MQTDELRAELAELARDVDPFTPALPAIPRRVARRRVAQMSIISVIVIGLVAGAIATTRSNGDHVNVAGHPKQVTIKELPRIDALVALRTGADVAAVGGILDATDVVEHYAKLPPNAFRTTGSFEEQLRLYPNLESFARAYGNAVILGVELDRSVANSIGDLRKAVGHAASVTEYSSLKGRAAYDDVEIFMTVKACAGEIDAVRAALGRDPDVVSYRFVSKTDALAEFRKLFKDEPDLIKNTKADALPISFQLRVRDDVLPSTVSARYQHVAGVKTVSTAGNPFAADQGFSSDTGGSSACSPAP
jgi:hypothetical protein